MTPLLPPRTSRTAPSRCPRASVAAGFSLVEITLALGLVGFALVAILGLLPVALTTSRYSIAQTRAAGLAETVFASLRVQPFDNAVPGDGLLADGSPPIPALNLSVVGADQPDKYAGSPDLVTLYALLTEAGAPASGDPRQLRFTADKDTFTKQLAQSEVATGGYEITLLFCKRPQGTSAVGQANRVVLTLRPSTGATGRSLDAFTFVSVIAKRGG